MTSSKGTTFFFAALIVLLMPCRAHAYLDPGTGSMVLQFLVAMVLGALFTIKVYWAKFKGFVANLCGKTREQPGSDPK